MKLLVFVVGMVLCYTFIQKTAAYYPGANDGIGCPPDYCMREKPEEMQREGGLADCMECCKGASIVRLGHYGTPENRMPCPEGYCWKPKDGKESSKCDLFYKFRLTCSSAMLSIFKTRNLK